MPRVLVVDDDEAMSCTTRIGLQQAGYDVDVAETSEAACALLAQRIPHAMLLDLKLPDTSGYRVLERTRDRGLVVPTAVITGYRLLFDPADAIALGAREYVHKPLFLEDMFQLVQRLTASTGDFDCLERLHALVVTGNSRALEIIASELLKRLTPRLQRAFPRAARDGVIDAVEDAILDYAARPGRFQISHGTELTPFVYLASRRNLIDRLRSDVRRSHREASYAALQPRTVAAVEDDYWIASSRLRTLLSAAGDTERRALKSWLEGDSGRLAETIQVLDTCPPIPAEKSSDSRTEC